MADETRHVTPGEPFEIELEENPTTGYVWRLELAVPGIIVTRDEYHPAPGAETGGGGMRVFRLEAESPGQYQVQFQLRRAWEKAAAETRVITIECYR